VRLAVEQVALELVLAVRQVLKAAQAVTAEQQRAALVMVVLAEQVIPETVVPETLAVQAVQQRWLCSAVSAGLKLAITETEPAEMPEEIQAAILVLI